MREVYITEAIRSPIGVGKPDRGDLLPLEPVALASRVLGAAVSRAGIGPAALDVLLGCVTPIGDQGANIGRLAALHARFPVEVPGLQLNRIHASDQRVVCLGHGMATASILPVDWVNLFRAGRRCGGAPTLDEWACLQFPVSRTQAPASPATIRRTTNIFVSSCTSEGTISSGRMISQCTRLSPIVSKIGCRKGT